MYFDFLLRGLRWSLKKVVQMLLYQITHCMFAIGTVYMLAPALKDILEANGFDKFFLMLLCSVGTVIFGKIAFSKARNVGFDLSLVMLDDLGDEMPMSQVIPIINKVRRLPIALSNYVCGTMLVSAASIGLVNVSHIDKLSTLAVAFLCIIWCGVCNAVWGNNINYSSIATVVTHVYSKKSAQLNKVLSTTYQSWCASASANFILDAVSSVLAVCIAFALALGVIRTLSMGATLPDAARFYASLIIVVCASFCVIMALYDIISALVHSCKVHHAHEALQTEELDDSATLNVASFEVRNGSLVMSDGCVILEDINISVKPGYKLGIVTTDGNVGRIMCDIFAGKKSLSHGSIMVDGKDTPAEQLSDVVSLVSSDIVWRLDTIKNNIGKNASDTMFSDVIKIASLHDFVHRTGQKESEVVSPHDPDLTPFKKRCISMARTVLSRASVVVVDDLAFGAPSSVEEHALQMAMRQFLNYRTVILVTSNPTFVSDFDSIVIIDGGKIVESGDHQSLVYSGGLYANLYMQYFGGVRNLH